MGFLGIFNSNEGKKNRKRARQYGQQADQQRGKIDDLLGDIVSQSGDAYQDANQTVQERYGQVLQDVQDQSNAQTAAGNQAISRGLMASGGDITGQGSVAMGQNQQRGNRAVQDALNYYTQRNEIANRQDERRGDQLTMNAVGAREGLYGTDLRQQGFYDQLERQRKQANKQLLGDFLGGAMKFAGGAI